MDFSSDDVERFRRHLEYQGNFPQPEPFFGNVQGSKFWLSTLIVDFGIGRTGEPVILLYSQGIVQDFTPSRELTQTSTEIEISEKPRDRFKRWLGDMTGNKAWSMCGVGEVTKTVAVKWDFTSCDIVKNLRYIAELSRRLGIKKVAIVSETGLNFNNIPAVIGDGIKVKVLYPPKTKADREHSFLVLRQFINSKFIRVMEGSGILEKLRYVEVSQKERDFGPKEAHPAVGAMALLFSSLRLDSNGQFYFPEDVS